MRNQALQWLRADLAALGKLLDMDGDNSRPAVQGRMSLWKEDTDHLTSVHDPKALEKLPPDERDARQKLRKDVDTLLAKTQEKN